MPDTLAAPKARKAPAKPATSAASATVLPGDRFGRDVTADLAAASGREWLVTNGIGGYAAASLTGMPTRGYHGLLVAALTPPLGRTLKLVTVLETVEVGGQRFELGSVRWRGGTVAPEGHVWLEEVRFEGISNDSSIEQIRLAVRKLVLQNPAPDGLISSSGGVSGTGGAILAIQAGLKDVGAVIGRDVDIVTKQLFANLPVFGDEFYVVHEDVRETGRVLAKALLGSIEGRSVSELQTMFVPTKASLQSTIDIGA